MRQPVSSLWALVSIVALLSFAPACASKGYASDAQPKPVQIEVKNNLTYPSELTVYIASASTRHILGSIGPSDTKMFTFTPRSYSETYRLIGQLPLSRVIRSQPFIVGSEMTGIISWTLVPNIVGFWEVEEDTLMVGDTAKAATDTIRQ